MTTGKPYIPRRYKCGERYSLLRLPFSKQSAMHRWCFLSVTEQKQLRVKANAFSLLKSKLNDTEGKEIELLQEMCISGDNIIAQYEFINYCSKIESIKYKIRKLQVSIYSSLILDVDGDQKKGYRQKLSEFSNIECTELFRFKKEDLKILIPLLFHEETIYIDKKGSYSKFSRDEIVLAGLWRLCNECKLFHLTLLMGRDHSQWARAINFFFDHLHTNYSSVLLCADSVIKSNMNFPLFSERIRNRLFFLSDYDLDENMIHNDYKNIIGFIDCVVTRVCRPGAGPKGLKHRDNTDLQRTVFNKYKADHGIKYQSLEAPNGLCLYLYGPCTNANHDFNILKQSKLDEIFEDCNLDLNIDVDDKLNSFKCFGDSAYIKVAANLDFHQKYVLTVHNPPICYTQQLYNKFINSARTSVEHSFGRTGKLFPYLNSKNNFKLLRNKQHKYYYEVATFLRNCYVILYGCLTNKIYDCYALPNLEDYLQGNFTCVDKSFSDISTLF